MHIVFTAQWGEVLSERLNSYFIHLHFHIDKFYEIHPYNNRKIKMIVNTLNKTKQKHENAHVVVYNTSRFI